MSREAIAFRIRNAHPDHHAIARGMAIGALFVFLSKLAGAAKEMAIAWRYGVSEVVDAYLFIFNLVNWPVAVWFGILAVVLVPLAITVRERAPGELPRFRGELLGLSLVLGFALWLIAEFGLPLFLRSRFSGLSGAALNDALQMTPVLSWLVFIGMPISLISVWIMAAQSYTNTLLEGIPALTILTIVLIGSRNASTALVWGTLVGFALHLFSLCAWCVQRREVVHLKFAQQSPHWRVFWRGFGIMLAGQVLSSLIGIVDQIFAAHLGAGAIATLGYANRIVALIVGLGATAVSRATLPIFSAAEAKGAQHVGRMAIHWARLLFGLGAVALITSWALAPWGVKLIFERGAFSANNTRAVAEVLRYGLFQIPFFFSSLVLVSVVSSRRNYPALLYAGGVGLALKLVSNAILVPWISLNALALSNAIFYAASGVYLLAMVGSDKPGDNVTPI